MVDSYVEKNAYAFSCQVFLVPLEIYNSSFLRQEIKINYLFLRGVLFYEYFFLTRRFSAKKLKLWCVVG